MHRIRVVIVDDHEVVRHGLRVALERESDMAVVGEAGSGAEAVAVARQTHPDVMLLDVKLGDVDGPEVCARVLQVTPGIAVVMLTNYEQDALVARSLAAGAKGYVIKDVGLADLKSMIRTVHRGGSVLDPKVAGRVISTATGRDSSPSARGTGARAVASLSAADLTTIQCLAAGLTNKEIAARLHLSPHTIKDRLEKIAGVLGVSSRTGIVAEALRRGLI